MTEQQMIDLRNKWVEDNCDILNYDSCYGIDIETAVLQLIRQVVAEVESHQTYGQWISY